MFYIYKILEVVLFIVPLLLAVAFLTLLERKVIGEMQGRKGPNIVGVFGLLQPFADGLKLIIKELVIPSSSNIFLFIYAPFYTFLLSLISWLVIPFGFFNNLLNLDLSVLYLFMFSSLSIYGILFSGWSSNSKYAFLGSLRSSAQMISYEVSLMLLVLVVVCVASSLSLIDILSFQLHYSFFFLFLPNVLMFFVSILAETNRSPFDLPEAEAELVAGYNVEYGALGFTLFFLAEYSNIILISSFFVVIFFGSFLDLSFFCYIFFSIKVVLVLFLFIWVRASFPRFRYDQLIRLGWKVFLPLALVIIVVLGFFLF